MHGELSSRLVRTMVKGRSDQQQRIIARDILSSLERLHGVYLDPAGADAFTDVGLTDPWDRYFAARASPLGAAGLSLVNATFYVFAPRLIAGSVPAVWTTVLPEEAHQARLCAADAAIRSRLPKLLLAEVRDTAELARAVAEECLPNGRPLFAAHASQPWPTEPHLQLWWAATLLREYRGDAHMALLVTNELDPVEALVSDASTNASASDFLKSFRGWNDDEWAAAVERLRARGLVDGAGNATKEGAVMRDELEMRTDELAAPWEAAGLLVSLLAAGLTRLELR